MKTPGLCMAVFLAGGLTASEAPPYSRQTLVDNPPMGAMPGAKPFKDAKESKGAVELRGFFGRGESLHVSLWKTDSKEALWIKVGATEGRFRVESASPESGSAVLFIDGIRQTMSLAKSDGAPLALPAVAVAPTVVSSSSGAQSGTPVAPSPVVSPVVEISPAPAPTAVPVTSEPPRPQKRQR